MGQSVQQPLVHTSSGEDVQTRTSIARDAVDKAAYNQLSCYCMKSVFKLSDSELLHQK